uniref:ANF_receptor domain-containing protein n=1 Tax=Steinernema glaseri TaxID=37863 RepID=A0A1I8ARF2_9BILA
MQLDKESLLDTKVPDNTNLHHPSSISFSRRKDEDSRPLLAPSHLPRKVVETMRTAVLSLLLLACLEKAASQNMFIKSIKLGTSFRGIQHHTGQLKKEDPYFCALDWMNMNHKDIVGITFDTWFAEKSGCGGQIIEIYAIAT